MSDKEITHSIGFTKTGTLCGAASQNIQVRKPTCPKCADIIRRGIDKFKYGKIR